MGALAVVIGRAAPLGVENNAVVIRVPSHVILGMIHGHTRTNSYQGQAGRATGAAGGMALTALSGGTIFASALHELSSRTGWCRYALRATQRLA